MSDSSLPSLFDSPATMLGNAPQSQRQTSRGNYAHRGSSLISLQFRRPLLLLEFYGCVLFTTITVVNALVYPTPQELDSLEIRDIALSLRTGFGNAFMSPTIWGVVLSLNVALREACRVPIVGIPIVAHDEERAGMRLDSEAVLITIRLAVVFMSYSMLVFILLGNTAYAFSIASFWAYVVAHFLPTTAKRRWGLTNARRSNLMSFLVRTLVVGVPTVILPRVLFPLVLTRWSPNDVVFVYPLFISFIEYLSVSILFINEVVAGYIKRCRLFRGTR